MTNNDIIRRIRYIFDFNNGQMVKLFAQADIKVSQEQVSVWLKKDDDPKYKAMQDVLLASFLNGLINDKRGKKPGPQPEPETEMTNNLVLRKLKIALNMTSDDILEVLQLTDFRLSPHELSAFFRKMDHKHYRVCKDQVLRNFLQGLQFKYREEK